MLQCSGGAYGVWKTTCERSASIVEHHPRLVPQGRDRYLRRRLLAHTAHNVQGAQRRLVEATSLVPRRNHRRRPLDAPALRVSRALAPRLAELRSSIWPVVQGGQQRCAVRLLGPPDADGRA
eukprot:1115352-Pleurochrysis_carterae.AAC.1